MSLNEWFLSLDKEHKELLKEDKWLLAEQAWRAAKEEAFQEAEKMGEVNLFARNRNKT